MLVNLSLFVGRGYFGATSSPFGSNRRSPPEVLVSLCPFSDEVTNYFLPPGDGPQVLANLFPLAGGGILGRPAIFDKHPPLTLPIGVEPDRRVLVWTISF